MIDHLTTLFRAALAITGTGTMAVGATAPTDTVWVKVVVVLCGLVTLMIGVMFTTLINHLVNHGNLRKEMGEIADGRIDRQSRLCSLKMKNMGEKIDKIYRHVCPEEEE